MGEDQYKQISVSGYEGTSSTARVMPAIDTVRNGEPGTSP